MFLTQANIQFENEVFDLISIFLNFHVEYISHMLHVNNRGSIKNTQDCKEHDMLKTRENQGF